MRLLFSRFILAIYLSHTSLQLLLVFYYPRIPMPTYIYIYMYLITLAFHHLIIPSSPRSSEPGCIFMRLVFLTGPRGLAFSPMPSQIVRPRAGKQDEDRPCSCSCSTSNVLCMYAIGPHNGHDWLPIKPMTCTTQKESYFSHAVRGWLIHVVIHCRQ